MSSNHRDNFKWINKWWNEWAGMLLITNFILKILYENLILSEKKIPPISQ